jgi:hypothetical protein
MRNLIFEISSKKGTTAASVPNPLSGHFSLFFNSDNKLSVKNSAGNVSSFIESTQAVFNKTFTLESPTATEDFSIFRTDVAITVQEVVAVSTGTSPSTTYVLRHSTDRNAAGSLLTTSGTTTSTTTGDVATLSVVAIPANSWIWLETTAASGTNVKLTIDIRYTID